MQSPLRFQPLNRFLHFFRPRRKTKAAHVESRSFTPKDAFQALRQRSRQKQKLANMIKPAVPSASRPLDRVEGNVGNYVVANTERFPGNVQAGFKPASA